MLNAEDLGFVHRFVPAQGENKVPTLLLLHGTGGDESDLLDLGHSLAPEAALLSPRGKVSEHGAARFFRRLQEGVFDIEDLHHRTHELARFVQQATETYRVDANPVIAVGYSNGANIAGSLLLLHPGLLRGAVLFRPMVPFVPDPMPDLSETHVLVSAGQSDPLVPEEQVDNLIALLGEAGAEVDVSWQPGGHGLDPGDIRLASEWLRRRRFAESLPER